ncbi:MAG: DUF6090 family protein [Saprospiraceae bacterium]
MIKFFRNFRRNLLSEGKTGKYLKYALGEIALVVIGILIALQINDWNDGRKNAIREYKLLTEMRINLQTDSIDMAGNIARNTRALILQKQFKINLKTT